MSIDIGQLMFRFLSMMPQHKQTLDMLRKIDVQQTLNTPQNQAAQGRTLVAQQETDAYTVEHVIEDGIERITYTPRAPKFTTPILMLHGMWHGAWCWQQWQELFAGWGWTSIAFSLPGHGKSPEQRPVPQCTLDYYLSFLRDEVKRLPQTPILMGHSMGGAITQWYLRYVSTDLPAVVLVGSWVHDAAMTEGVWLFTKIDPMGVWLALQKGDAAPYVRNPYHAARKLISSKSIYTPEQLHARLGPESALVTVQHNPPLWKPADKVNAPMLYISGGRDTVLSVGAGRRTAQHYGADFILVPESAHNLMMDADYQQTAAQVNEWLQKNIR